MNLVVIAAIIAVCSAAKLDRTYLPPATAKTAGGSPGSLQTPFAGNSLNQGLGSIPKGSYTNEFQGVVVDAVSAGTRASGPEETGLGAPRVNYGSLASKVGEAAFKDSPAGFRQSQGSAPVNLAHGGQTKERAQASRDRDSNIVLYSSDVGPESFSYAFQTDNGITAVENGVEADGVKAQGGFSYTDDDGHMYSVSYTADEGGYQPKGDHLPTPPPIPEEILKSLELNAKEEAAGVIDDGSYDAQKYNTGGDYSESESDDTHNVKQSINKQNRPGFSNTFSSNKPNAGSNHPSSSGNLAISQAGSGSGIPSSQFGLGSKESLGGNGPASTQFGQASGFHHGQAHPQGTFASASASFAGNDGNFGQGQTGFGSGHLSSQGGRPQGSQGSGTGVSSQGFNAQFGQSNQIHGRPQGSHSSASAFTSGSSLGNNLAQGQPSQGAIGQNGRPQGPQNSNAADSSQGYQTQTSGSFQSGQAQGHPQGSASASFASGSSSNGPSNVHSQSNQGSESKLGSVSGHLSGQGSDQGVVRPSSHFNQGYDAQTSGTFQSNKIQSQGRPQGSYSGASATFATGSSSGSNNVPHSESGQGNGLSSFGSSSGHLSGSGIGQHGKPDQGIKPSSSQGPDVAGSTSGYNVQSSQQVGKGQGQTSHSDTSTFSSGSQSGVSQPSHHGFQQSSTNKQSQFGSSNTPHAGSNSQSQSQSSFGSFGSQQPTAQPQTELTTPFESNSGPSTVAHGFQSHSQSSFAFNSQTANTHPTQSQFGVHSSKVQGNGPGGSQAPIQTSFASASFNTQSSVSQGFPTSQTSHTQVPSHSSGSPTQGQYNKLQFQQNQFSQGKPNDVQFSASTQRPSFSQGAQGQDNGYFYNQPSQPFAVSSQGSKPFSQGNVGTQSTFSSESSAQFSSSPSQGVSPTAFPSQHGQPQGSTKYPRPPTLASIAPTAATRENGQYQGSTGSVNGITRATASSFVSVSPTISPHFTNQQSGQFGSRPNFSQSSGQSNTQSQFSSPHSGKPSFNVQTTAIPHVFPQRPTALFTQTNSFQSQTQSGQQPSAGQKYPGTSHDSSQSTSSQQYDGELYEYNKPPETLPAPAHKDTTSTSRKPAQIGTQLVVKPQPGHFGVLPGKGGQGSFSAMFGIHGQPSQGSHFTSQSSKASCGQGSGIACSQFNKNSRPNQGTPFTNQGSSTQGQFGHDSKPIFGQTTSTQFGQNAKPSQGSDISGQITSSQFSQGSSSHVTQGQPGQDSRPSFGQIGTQFGQNTKPGQGSNFGGQITGSQFNQGSSTHVTPGQSGQGSRPSFGHTVITQFGQNTTPGQGSDFSGQVTSSHVTQGQSGQGTRPSFGQFGQNTKLDQGSHIGGQFNQGSSSHISPGQSEQGSRPPFGQTATLQFGQNTKPGQGAGQITSSQFNQGSSSHVTQGPSGQSPTPSFGQTAGAQFDQSTKPGLPSNFAGRISSANIISPEESAHGARPSLGKTPKPFSAILDDERLRNQGSAGQTQKKCCKSSTSSSPFGHSPTDTTQSGTQNTGRPSQGSVQGQFTQSSTFVGGQGSKPDQITGQSVAGKGEVFGGPRPPPSFDEQTGYHY